ncbi:hypothetical protein D3C86_888130 [compost metagenome]
MFCCISSWYSESALAMALMPFFSMSSSPVSWPLTRVSRRPSLILCTACTISVMGWVTLLTSRKPNRVLMARPMSTMITAKKASRYCRTMALSVASCMEM